MMLILLFSGSATAQSSLGEQTVVFSTELSNSIPDSNHLADSNFSYVIRNITITGNKITKPNIILREVAFEINEAYSMEQIVKRFAKARKQLMNSGLFGEVIVSLKSISGFDVYVNIHVSEKWYIWPKPYIKSVDRSFQEWWS
ncbi:MAG: POTRA domain-containing protein, partial [Flavisolibacter sp.]